MYLYIPIWFYSNKITYKLDVRMNTFTFQSGSIQMKTNYYRTFAIYSFTFQSGSIQMALSLKDCLLLSSLHSNLVLFKSDDVTARREHVLPLHSNLVLFKLKFSKNTYDFLKLYIPIWFYSNTNLNNRYRT